MRSKILRFIIFGAPGSGKGTISSRIIEKYDMKLISLGDILRKNISEKTELGLIAKKYIANGMLVPDLHVIECIMNELNRIRGHSWLLDGFPRTINQAEKLWNVVNVDTVLDLNVPIDVIIDRIKDRWIHAPSGRTYNIGFNEPKVPFKDDITGEPLIQRHDDHPEAVRKRLEIYESCTKPVSHYYADKGILESFSGDKTAEIWPEIEKYLQNKFES